MLLTVTVFGQLCPLLLLLAPLWAWTNHFTTSWQQQHADSDNKSVVDKILVQQPTTAFGVSGRIMHCVVTIVVFIDLEFEVEPIAVYFILFVAIEVVLVRWRRHDSKAASKVTLLRARLPENHTPDEVTAKHFG